LRFGPSLYPLIGDLGGLRRLQNPAAVPHAPALTGVTHAVAIFVFLVRIPPVNTHIPVIGHAVSIAVIG